MGGTGCTEGSTWKWKKSECLIKGFETLKEDDQIDENENLKRGLKESLKRDLKESLKGDFSFISPIFKMGGVLV